MVKQAHTGGVRLGVMGYGQAGAGIRWRWRFRRTLGPRSRTRTRPEGRGGGRGRCDNAGATGSAKQAVWWWNKPTQAVQAGFDVAFVCGTAKQALRQGEGFGEP